MIFMEDFPCEITQKQSEKFLSPEKEIGRG
jgi:hypothetical protein